MTPNKEDYLKCIYEIITQHEKVTNKLISQMMNVSAPAVTEMLRKLLLSDLIVKDNKIGYKLTKIGLLQVSKLVRKHRILEVFLVEKLKYSVEDVHNEAEVLEHSVSDLFIDRLNIMLDYPTHCPHGSVIPKKNEILQEETIPLSKALVNKTYSIARVSQKKELVSYMNKLNIRQGVFVEIVDHDKVAQLIHVKINNKLVVISEAIATQIFLII